MGEARGQDFRDRLGTQIDTVERAYFSLLPDLTPFRIQGTFESAEPIIDTQGNLTLRIRTIEGRMTEVQFAAPVAHNLSQFILNYEYYARRQWEFQRLKLPPALVRYPVPRYEQNAPQIFVTLNDGQQFYGQALFVTPELDSVVIWQDLEGYDFMTGKRMTIPIVATAMIKAVDYRRHLPYKYLLGSVGLITGGVLSFAGNPVLEHLKVEQNAPAALATTVVTTGIGLWIGALLDVPFEYRSRRFTSLDTAKNTPKRRERLTKELRQAALFQRLPPPEFAAGRRAWKMPK